MSIRSFFPSVFARSCCSPILASSLIVVFMTSCACTDQRKPEADNKDHLQNQELAVLAALSSPKVSAQQAIAEVKSFKGDQIKGRVMFTQVPNGIKIVADVDGLSPGKHGFHVHEFGDCTDESTVGAHFNPTNSKHGGPDSPERHVGDLGNLVADHRGHAHYERVDNIITLEGQHSILGLSVVIHADPDDFVTQPTGASGKKIACGIIQAVEDKR